MSYKKSMSIELASLITLVGVSILITTASLFPVSQVQAQSVNIPLGTKVNPDAPNPNISPNIIKAIQTATTSLPSIAELRINLGGAYYQASGNQLITWNTKNLVLITLNVPNLRMGERSNAGYFRIIKG